MPDPFLDTAREALRLTPEHLRYLQEGSIRSFDALDSVLRASPSLDDISWFRRDKLLAALEPLLSEAYRRVRDQPAPDFPMGGVAAPPGESMPMLAAALPTGPDLLMAGAAAPPVRAMRAAATLPPVPNWPSSERNPALGDAAADLLDAVRERWPVRSQDDHGAACVGFAAGAAMERARTPQGADKPPSLSALFVYQRIFARFPGGSGAAGASPGGEDGPTRLSEASEVLREDGICARSKWPDNVARNDRPDADAIADAKPHRLAAFDYWDLNPERFAHPPAVARTVLDLLLGGRPVVVSLPEFRDPRASQSLTNWRTPAARQNGVVQEKQEGWEKAGIGHAVCLLGFHPDASAPGGGWFIFRNSWGKDWASGAPDPGGGAPVPAAGYGALSAAHVEEHVWEIFSPAAG